MDLSKLSDRQLMALKSSGGDLSKLDNETLLALRPAQAQGRSDALANAFGQGATFNFGDEFTAAVRAAFPDFSNWMMRGPALQRAESIGGSPTPQTVSTAPTLDQRYDEELNRVRKQTRADAEAYPVMTTAGNVAGNVATTALALPAAATSMGPSLIGNALKLGATGAGMGATAGFGSGEGGFDSRLGSAVLPATVGGALGFALPFAGALGRSVIESAPGRAVADRVSAVLSRGAPPATVEQTGAAQRLATALQRANLDPSDVRMRLDQLGEGAMLADVDTQMAKLARTARSMPGGTSSLADDVLTARQNQMPGILRRAFEGDTPPPQTFTLRGEGQAFDQNARAVGQRVYGQMASDALDMSDEMQQLANVPAIRDALSQIADDAASTGRTLQPIEIMHRVKQKLNDTAQAAFASGKPINKADLGELARTWESAFWRANPSAQAADATYAQAKSLPEFFDRGYSVFAGGTGEKAMNASGPALADALSGANPQQIAATRAGATNVVRDLTGGRNALGQTRSLARDLPSEGIAARVGEIYEPAQAAEIQRVSDALRTFDKTDKFIRGGSQTVDKALDVVDDMSNVRVSAGSGGLGARLWDTAERIGNRLLAPNETIRDAIGRAMLNPNTAENKKILDLAAALLNQRAQGRPLAAGLIEGAASQTGGR